MKTAATLRPTDLRIDDDPCPLGLDSDMPAFSWIPVSAERAQVQSAYQVQVASDPARRVCGWRPLSGAGVERLDSCQRGYQ